MRQLTYCPHCSGHHEPLPLVSPYGAAFFVFDAKAKELVPFRPRDWLVVDHQGEQPPPPPPSYRAPPTVLHRLPENWKG